MTGTTHLVGVISDTHSLMRPEALEALQGCELIIHAGDVGRSDVLEALREIAPVVAVRGNVDRRELARVLRQTAAVEVGGVWIYVIHNLQELDLDPANKFGVVISGHTHQALTERREGVLYLNPGSAGPRHFNRPVTLALLRIHDGTVQVEQVELKISAQDSI